MLFPKLLEKGISIELIDLRSIKPIDLETILQSVTKTHKLLVVDGGWKTGGVAAEIIAQVTETQLLQTKPARLNITRPASTGFQSFGRWIYISQNDVFQKVMDLMEGLFESRINRKTSSGGWGQQRNRGFDCSAICRRRSLCDSNWDVPAQYWSLFCGTVRGCDGSTQFSRDRYDDSRIQARVL
jgi:hypothetical protein